MSTLPIYPFDADRAIGTVIEIAGNTVKVNLPQAAAPGSRWHHGHQLEAGRVGEFVVVESGHAAVFGRITAVRLPERERLSVEEDLGGRPDVHPIGIVSLVASVDLASGKIEPGVPHHPRLGARCFSAHPLLIKWLAESTRFADTEGGAKLLTLATLPFSSETLIRVAPESLFGRHCAVLGTTGGGKSWTLARLIEEAGRHKSKILLIDPTGEFHTLNGPHIQHIHVNSDSAAEQRGSFEVVLPYKRLLEGDLFALFQPAPQSQAPKLRAAIKSLKTLHYARLVSGNPAKYASHEQAARALLTQVGEGRNIPKPESTRAPYENASRAFAELIDKPASEFEIAALAEQIQLECCWPSGQGASQNRYGGVHQGDLGYCINLVSRVEQIVSSSEFACLFRPGDKKDILMDVLLPFLANDSLSVLVLSLKELSFSNNIREIFVNSIGRQLLLFGRKNKLVSQPLIVFLDEAHQFIGKSLGEEGSKLKLDSFELIAKEGRKFGLTLCLATQRPRDIGQGILSQMGAYLVHRLTNPEDREIVERAAGDLDRSAAAFVPTLAAGQAILIGTDFPIPVTLQIIPPSTPPKSSGPRYQEFW